MRRLLALALVAAALAGCSDDGGGGDETSAASAITAQAPDGYHLLVEGRGEQELFWGSDSMGNTGGFVVLGPSADATDPSTLTRVELTGFEGYQGGLGQTSLRENIQELEIDGQPALLSTAGEITQLVAVRSPDIAVGIQSASMDRDQLLDLLDRSEVPAGGNPPTDPPEVSPPEGLHVVGRGNADVSLALFAWADGGYLGASPRAQGLAWDGRGGDDHLIVLTLPGGAGDPAAALGYGRAYRLLSEAERLEVDGREAVFVSAPDRNILTTTSEWGDLLFVISSTSGVDPQLLERDELAAVAESVEPA